MKHNIPALIAALLAYFKDNHEAHPDYEIVQDGDWTDELKWQYKTTVVRLKTTEIYLAIHETRSGSYYSDYTYDEPTVTQVVPRQVTRTEYLEMPTVIQGEVTPNV